MHRNLLKTSRHTAHRSRLLTREDLPLHIRSRRLRCELLEDRRLLDAAGGEQAMELFNSSPALFVENQGQWADESVRYALLGSGANVLHTEGGPAFQLFQRENGRDIGPRSEPFEPEETATRVAEFSVGFDGANKVQPVGLDRAETVYNYYVGEESDWRSDVPAYETVAYRGLYEGIDLFTQGRRDSLKYEFHVAPGADYRQIRVDYEGIEGLSLDEDGALHVETSLGEVVDDAPLVYQQIDGRQVEVAGRFDLIDVDTVSFVVSGDYDPGAELVIDPNLAWSSYLGGSELDWAEDVALDASGGVWVTGLTVSSGWASGGSDVSHNGGGDVFVTRLNASGDHLWSTYLGGSNTDWGSAIVVEPSGNAAWVTGSTMSSGWVSGGFDTSYGGGSDAFVARISSDGGLLWSSYLGGNERDVGYGIAVDASRNILVTGGTESAGWLGSLALYHGNRDGFVVQISPKAGMLAGRYLGGAEADEAYDVAVDADGYAWVTGYTDSSGWATGSPHSSVYHGNRDAFVARLKPLAPLVLRGPHDPDEPEEPGGFVGWSRYLGFKEPDVGRGIAVDASGNAYVTGRTETGVWLGFDNTYNGGDADAFVAQIDSDGRMPWGRYVGGSNLDEAYAVAVDDSGGPWIVGTTDSSGWVQGGFDTDYEGGGDAFVARWDSVGNLLWSSYLGGTEEELGLGIASAGAGINASAWVTGATWSPDWVWGGHDATYNGDGDAFVARLHEIGFGPLRDLQITNSDVTLSPEGDEVRVTGTVHNRSYSTIRDVSVRFHDGYAGGFDETVIIPEIPAWGSADASVLWTPAEPNSLIEVIVDPFDVITETNENNNRALGCWGGTKPRLQHVRANWDGDSDPSTFGRYVSGVSLLMPFIAWVADPDGYENIDYVEFTLGPLGTKRAYFDSGEFYDFEASFATEFDVGQLSGDTTLTAVAYDNQGHASDPWTGTVHLVPFPSWLGTPGDDDYFDRSFYGYRLTGFFPEGMEWWYTAPDWIPVIGNKETGFRIGIESTVEASLSTSVEPEVGVAAVAYAKLFGDVKLDERFLPEYETQYFSLTSRVDVYGDSLELEGLEVTAELTDYPVAHYGTGEHELAGLTIPLLMELSLRVSAVIDAKLNAGLTLYFDGSGVSVSEAFIRPAITGTGKLICSAGVALGFASMDVDGSVELTFYPELSYRNGEWDAGLDGTLRVPYKVEGCILWWICGTIAEGVIPDEDGWEFNLSKSASGTVSAMSAPLETVAVQCCGQPSVPPMLAADQDAAGNAIVVRTVDADPSPGGLQSDVYFTYRPAGGQWTELAPLAESSQWLSGPVVALDGQGGAVAVWVANSLPQGERDTPTLSEVFQHQDLYGSYFNGKAWSTPVRITDDKHADGLPVLASDPATGNALLAWTRSELADATDPTGYEIAYATWDHVHRSWSAPALITSDAAADWSPRIAFNDASVAMAIWPRDADGDLTTVELAYAELDAGWSIPKVSSNWQWASEMAITAVPDGSFLVTAVEESQKNEALLSASYNPAAHTWTAATQVTPDGIAQEPRVRVNSSGTAAVLWQGVADNGNNDLWLATRDLAGGGGWTNPYQLTDDPEVEWMPVLLFDDAGNPYAAYELDDGVGGGIGAGRGEGFPDLGDDVGIAAVDLVPDLVAENIEAMTALYVNEARLMVDVVNRGLVPAAATTVEFYAGNPDAGGDLIAGPVDVKALAPGQAAYAVSDVFKPSVGGGNYYAVVTPDPAETVTDNNSVHTLFHKAAPDVAGPHVTVGWADGGIVPVGTGELTLTFSEPIASLSGADISLVEDSLGTRPPDHVFLASNRTSGLLIFEGGLAAGDYTLKVRDSVMDMAGNALDGDEDGSAGGDYVVTFEVTPAVVGRHVFYNDSAFDGSDPAANAEDDGAIAPDKEALLPGGTAGFVNYTSYRRGINGIMVDVAGLAGTPTTDDFQFKVGNNADPDGWAEVIEEPAITVREGAGVDGSDRITIVWPDNAVEKQWLQVTVLATEDTALADDDVFYFGNAVGETGNSPTDAKVNSTDEIGVRGNPHFLIPAAIDDAFDFDRNRRVGSLDQVIARRNIAMFGVLRLIDAPATDAALAAASEQGPTSVEAPLDGLAYELEQIASQDRTSRKVEAAEAAVDELLATYWQ